MKSFLSIVLTLGLIVVLLGGCSKKDINSELAKATEIMAKPESAQPEPAQTPSQQVPQYASTPKLQAQEMSQAIAAYKAGNLDDAVVRLQKLRSVRVMAPEKRMALNDAIAAVMNEVSAMAEKGDARAIQALKTFTDFQTHPQ